MIAYQWISGIVFPAAKLTVWSGQVSRARRTVNCCRPLTRDSLAAAIIKALEFIQPGQSVVIPFSD